MRPPARRSPRAAGRCRPTRSSRARARAPRGPSRRAAPRPTSTSTIASASASGSPGGTSTRRLGRRDGRVARDVRGDRPASRTRTPRRARARSSRRRARARRTASRAASSCGPHLVRHDPEHVDAVVVEAQPRVQQTVLQRVGADQPQPRAGRAGGSPARRAAAIGKPFARVVAADEDDVVLAVRPDRRAPGISDAVRDHAVVARAASARPTRPPSARRRSAHRSGRSGSPRSGIAERIQPRSPCGVPGRDDRALRERERRDADRGRHRLVQVDDVEPLVARAPRGCARSMRGESTMFGSEPFAGTTTERPTGMTSGGRSPWRPRARVQEARERARRVVAPSRSSRRGRARAARRPGSRRARRRRPSTTTRTGTTIPIFMRTPPRTRGASRSAPRSSVSSATASESRAQPAPLGPKPSPGATATRCSSEQALGGQPLGQPQPDVERALADRRLGQRGDEQVAPALVVARRAPRPSPAGPSSAAIAASCSGAKMPTREWSFSRLMRSTISALPTTKPIRQPGHAVRLRHRPQLDARRPSRPASRGSSRGSRPSKTRSMYAASCTTAPPVRSRPGDRGLERAGRRADRARVRGVVEVERGRRRRGVEVGRPAAVGVERHGREARRRRARRPTGSRGSTGRAAGSCRPRSASASGELDDRRLRARDDRDLALGVELDAVDVAVARGDRLAAARQPAERRVAVDVGASSRLARAPRRRAAAARPRGCRGRGRRAAARPPPPRRRRGRAAATKYCSGSRSSRCGRAPTGADSTCGRRVDLQRLV